MIIKAILMLLIKIGQAAAVVLPLHTPMEVPDFGIMFAMLTGFAAFDRFIPIIPLISAVMIILVFEAALRFYAVYRVVIGFIPGFR